MLLTNVPEDEFGPHEVLREYKFQTAVETRFKFLKSPVYMNTVYVHRRDRLEALIYVLVMACLLFALLERRVRSALAERGETLTVPGNRKVDNPTATSLLEMLANVVVVRAGPHQPRLRPTAHRPRPGIGRLLLDQLTHRSYVLLFNGESYRRGERR